MMNEPDYEQDNLKLFNADCMAIMAQYPDQYFDLAVVDPPYFSKLGNPKGYYGGNKSVSDTGVKRTKYKEFENWDVPDESYFNELYRVSKNQIIWGCNYYAKYIPHVSRIYWDKKNDSSSFSKGELASKSMNLGIDVFRFEWNGMLQEDMKNKESRIHPTQKPVRLYNWIYTNYAKPGQKILDTHLGSGSNAISAHYSKMGEFVGCELDADYFKASIKRIYSETRQLDLF